MVSGSAMAAVYIAGPITVLGDACNDTQHRLTAVLISPGGGAGLVTSVAFGDVNNDGMSDLLAVRRAHSLLVSLAAVTQGQVVFTDASLLAPSGACVVLWDVNSDGWTDVVSSDSTGNSLTAVVNSGVAPFVSPTVSVLATISVVNTVTGMVALAVNNDTWMDVAWTDGAGLHLTLGAKPAAGTGMWTAGGDGSGRFVGGSSCSLSGVVAADVDGDGDVDLLSFGGTCGTLWLNDGTGTFVSQLCGLPAISVATAVGAAAADMDNDGDMDVYLSSGSGSALYSNAITAGVAALTVSSMWSGPASAAVLVDVDNDGALDVPAVGAMAQLAPAARLRSAYVRALGRNGTRNQFGATICLTSTSATTYGCIVT